MSNDQRKLIRNAKVRSISGKDVITPVDIEFKLSIAYAKNGIISDISIPDISKIFLAHAKKAYDEAYRYIKDGKIKYIKDRKYLQGEKCYKLENVSDENMYNYFAEIMTCIIMGCCAVESKLNFIISERHKKLSDLINIEDNLKIKSNLESLDDFIKQFGTKDKIQRILKLLSQKNKAISSSKRNQLLNSVGDIFKLRNDIVHAKYKKIRDPNNYKKSLWTALFPKENKNSKKLSPKKNYYEIAERCIRLLDEINSHILKI